MEKLVLRRKMKHLFTTNLSACCSYCATNASIQFDLIEKRLPEN